MSVTVIDMFVDNIKTASPFRDLFPIQERVLDEIYWDIQKTGYDKSKPIVLWESHDSVVIDGHTRLRAARKAGLGQIPVVLKAFPDEENALQYAIRSQRNRRNLTAHEILTCIAELDKRRKAGRPGNDKLAQDCANFGKSAQETAGILGISVRKVEQARTVQERASDDIKEAVKSGEMSINAAYNRTVNPSQGSPESLDTAACELEKIDKIIGIIRERLTKEQIKELIIRLQAEV